MDDGMNACFWDASGGYRGRRVLIDVGTTTSIRISEKPGLWRWSIRLLNFVSFAFPSQPGSEFKMSDIDRAKQWARASRGNLVIRCRHLVIDVSRAHWPLPIGTILIRTANSYAPKQASIGRHDVVDVRNPSTWLRTRNKQARRRLVENGMLIVHT